VPLALPLVASFKYQLEVVHHDGNQTQSNIPKMRVK
jgi:hypothetical protein